ncbi:hypothetical protein BCV77_13085 [Salmonella enterica]|nr:hypothetical protein [Salmonella enterica]EAU0254204.1 hypothetical protein [Salmonella enterica]
MAMRLSVRWKKDRKLQFRLALFTGGRSQASFVTGNWCYDRHRSVRLVIRFDLAIDQIAQSGLSSLNVIYYSAQLFSSYIVPNHS